MVLQDPCPRDAAEQVLLAGVDFATHCNPAPGPMFGSKRWVSTTKPGWDRPETAVLQVKSEGLPEGTPHFADAERLKKRICVGQYHFDQKEATMSVKYAAVDGEYRLTLLLRHSKACSESWSFIKGRWAV